MARDDPPADPLEEYRERRDPERTPEPAGGSPRRSGDTPLFVIQHHAASSTHFDLRLEVGGVLASWAVPKGPSTDPRERRLARVLVDRRPSSYTLEQRTSRRGGRLYLDVMRNAYGQHVVAPYAVRAREGAPVAAPLGWEELGTEAVGPRSFDVTSVPRRLEEEGDPWKGAWRRARSLRGVAERLPE